MLCGWLRKFTPFYSPIRYRPRINLDFVTPVLSVFWDQSLVAREQKDSLLVFRPERFFGRARVWSLERCDPRSARGLAHSISARSPGNLSSTRLNSSRRRRNACRAALKMRASSRRLDRSVVLRDPFSSFLYYPLLLFSIAQVKIPHDSFLGF